MATDEFERFLRSYSKNQRTFSLYRDRITEIAAPFSPSELLRKGKTKAGRLAVEEHILTWIERMTKSEQKNGSTLRNCLSILRLFFKYDPDNVVNLNWKSLFRACAPATRIAKRAPMLEEIQKLYEILDTRGKFILSLMSSAGFRVGAFDYFSMRDFHVTEVIPKSGEHGKEKTKIARLTVYRGDAEQYTGRASTECIENFEAYIQERRLSGEIITPDSPLIRNPINRSKEDQEVKRTKREEIMQFFFNHWGKVGLATREFKMTHGFRAFFDVKLQNAGCPTVIIRRLHNHLEGMDKNYYLPTEEQLDEIYAFFQSALFISKAFHAESKVSQINSNTQKKLAEVESAYVIEHGSRLRLEDKVERLESQLDGWRDYITDEIDRRMNREVEESYQESIQNPEKEISDEDLARIQRRRLAVVKKRIP
jgi:hypothetical protein